jgi:hypothetical protein
MQLGGRLLSDRSVIPEGALGVYTDPDAGALSSSEIERCGDRRLAGRGDRPPDWCEEP